MNKEERFPEISALTENMEPLLPKSVAEIDNAIVQKIDVIYEDAIPSLLQEAIPGEIDWSKAFTTMDATTGKHSSRRKGSKDKRENNKTPIAIPSAEFYEDDTLETMVLLENISEMGDHREIPYLKYLLENEPSADVEERIRGLIKRFTAENKGIAYFKVTQLEAGDSVFNELMEKSDPESKLILLEQIIEVGDEKEIPLLNAMIASGEEEIIRKKAKSGLKKLMKRLALEHSQETDSGFIDENDDAADIFEVNFKVHKSKSTDNKEPVLEKDGNTLFDHLCAMSTKLYNKFNW